jgi:hypothetical protein
LRDCYSVSSTKKVISGSASVYTESSVADPGH